MAGDEKAMSYAELDRAVSYMRQRLAQMGVEPGDRVGVMMSNRIAFPICWLGIVTMGASMVPLNRYYQSADAAHLISHSGMKILILEPEYVPVAQKACAELGQELSLLVFADTADEEFLHTPPEGGVEVATRPVGETVANIQYTSGTTGLPKGCVLTHLYWCRLARMIAAGPPLLGVDDVLFTAQPFYYMDPQWNLVTAMTTGATLVVAPRFSATKFWQQVRHDGVTFFYCLGMMPAALLAQPVDPQEADHKVRAVLVSGIPVDIHGEMEERFGVKWYESYGMTETGGDLRMPESEHDRLVGTGAIGMPYHDREVRVVDDAGAVVPRGENGQLILRGPGLMDRYFRDPDATARVFGDGWFHTGDVVRQDSDGMVYFVGRTKDMIRRSGENVAAVEVERVIAKHPGVLSVACVPEPDALRGEEVKAFVILDGTPGAADVEDRLAEIRAWCGDKLAYFKIPRYWSAIESFPLTPSERVAKGQLVTQAREQNIPVWDLAEQRGQ